ncbi:MAG: Hdr-like menaquinol oxidoreductase cytochrome c subunit [Betaproteobacteria bacterium]|nr:Hdr-like menaquinol oxidoreductase cytochrome c subunit [Betaproteobacteria bacterium]
MKLRLALLGLCLAAAAGAAGAGGTPKPMLEPARGGQCVAPPEVMRRDHPEMLKHQRDETVRGGVRGAASGAPAASLAQCVECHASKASGSVAARREDFCASCHAYAGVRLDCFECHTSKAKGAAR